MSGAAILDYAQAAGRDLIVYPVVQDNDAVGDIFLQTLSGDLAIAGLAGNKDC